MPSFDSARLAKLLEMAGHPSSSDGEALNSLRAARTMLDRAGRSLSDLAGAGTASPRRAEPGDAEVQRMREELRRLQSENSRLRKENARIEALKAELALLQDAAGMAPATAGAPLGRVSIQVVEVYDLLTEWRSITDLVEKLGARIGAPEVRRIVRLLDDKGLLRSVESLPTRYRLRFEGELGETARAFRARIDDARPNAQPS